MITTIAATSASPAYSGPDPEHCLEAAGLTNVRPSPEEGAWVGNIPGTALTDTRSIVILSGPYASGVQATQYAASLNGIEIAVAVGRWVSTAALTSHLDDKVAAAANCMAGP